MNIFVYSDESGVLDKKHNEYFVFGGIVFLSIEDRDIWNRKFIAAERNIKLSDNLNPSIEPKASNISISSKNKLYKLLTKVERFGIVIDESRLNDQLFYNKKEKQRYLDWAFKMAIKNKFQNMISRGLIIPSEVDEIDFFVDEHTTATNGKYELRESLEQELKNGMFNYKYNSYYPPLFSNVKSLNLQNCNSEKKPLIRASDIVANRLYYYTHKYNGKIPDEDKLQIMYHPYKK